ncbi:MAG: YceI family protein [Actinomycetota bacterium]|nr:YceI family protein [Actinomycetota bacterium]
MTIQAGTHKLGPSDGSLQVKTGREGKAAKAGHNLVIDVTSWEATVDAGEDGSLDVELNADGGSLKVASGEGGAKALTDKDKQEIDSTTKDKVLGGQPIKFKGSGDGSGSISGDLTIGGATNQVTAQLNVGDDGKVSGTIPINQSDFNITPYKAMMGALKVKDQVEVVIDAQLPAD